MITKNDCYLLLADLQESGINTDEILNELIKSPNINLNIIKFINDNRQLDLTNFYEQIRKSYNHKNSTLYGNIVKEIKEPTEVLTTLSAMLTQILRYSKNVDNKEMFLRHSRANDICKVLSIYTTNYDLTNCLKLMRLIKADIKALENIKN